MADIQDTDAVFDRQRKAALIPFAALCLAALAVLMAVKMNTLGRPALKTLDEMRAAQGAAPGAATAPGVSGEPAPSPMEGKPMPDAELRMLGGKTAKLSSYRGKVLLINIWATWCAPCRDEMPSMEKLYRELKGSNFELLAISIDKDGEKSVAPFIKEVGVTFPVFLDPAQVTPPLYKITGVPETFLVNPEGVILHHLIGPTQWDRPVIIDALRTLAAKTASAADTKPIK